MTSTHIAGRVKLSPCRDITAAKRKFDTQAQAFQAFLAAQDGGRRPSMIGKANSVHIWPYVSSDNHLAFLIAPLGFGSITPVLQSAGPPRPNQFHTQVSKITGLGQLPAANFTLINNAIAALGRPFDVFFLLSFHLNDPYRLEAQILYR
jgi:hypothetical protein